MAGATVSIVIGTQFGDEGKGMGVHRLYSSSIVGNDKEIIRPSVTVRFNGGSQAAHNVIAENGIHHTFRQFGSGYLANQHQITYLHKTMLVDPWMLLEEASVLDSLFFGKGYDALDSVVIHRDAPILLPLYAFENKVREMARGNDRHGSCGMGIGALAEDIALDNLYLTHQISSAPQLLIADALQAIVDAKKIALQPLIDSFTENQLHNISHDLKYYFGESFAEEYSSWLCRRYLPRINTVLDTYLYTRLHEDRHIVFEGAQGILLDEWRGFHPHTTWSSTNLRNVHQIFEDYNYKGEYHTYGMVRGYGTRHGFGPFPSEKEDLHIVDESNGYGLWQGQFRVGNLDLVLLRYALTVAKDPGSRFRGIDSLQISCLDQVENSEIPIRMINSYYNFSTCTQYWNLPVNPNIEDLSFQETLGKDLESWIYNTTYPYVKNIEEDFPQYIAWHAYKQPTISFVSKSAQQQPNQIIKAVYEA